MKKNFHRLLMLALVTGLVSPASFANTYSMPLPNEGMVGMVQYTTTAYNDNVVEIAERYDLGVNQVSEANHQLDVSRGFPGGIPMKLPTAFLLPAGPREGIVVNLSEMRLYYYPKGSGIVKTYPVGIGKVGKTIPLTKTFVSRKLINPIWTPTKSIREFNRERGIILPASIPPGPDNPLGPYAIYLGIPEYRIHSTIFPDSIGKRASFGCIRMTEKDIKDFFPLVSNKTPVNIIDQPTKVGWLGDTLYLESHPPLEERPTANSDFSGMVAMIDQASGNQPVLIDWQLVSYLAKEHDGTPHDVGIRLR